MYSVCVCVCLYVSPFAAIQDSVHTTIPVSWLQRVEIWKLLESQSRQN